MTRLLIFVLACVAILALALLPSRGNEIGGGTGPPIQTREITVPSPGQFYTRSTAGDYDGDGQQDFAYVLGKRVDVMLAPGMFESRMNNVVQANDVATIQSYPYDLLLAVEDEGLTEIVWNPVAPHWDSTVRAAGDWLGATQVRTWTRGSGAHWVFGLDSTRTRLLSMFYDTHGWSPGTSVTTSYPEPITEIEPFDYDGDGSPELGIITASKLAVYDPWSGTPETPVLSGGFKNWTNTALGLVRQDQLDAEWLAWIWTDGNGALQKFGTLGFDGLQNVQPIGTGLGVFALATGDVDGNGSGDLVASYTDSWSMIAIPNSADDDQPPVFSGSMASQHVFSPIGNASNNRAHPTIVDIDGDGDGDVCFPMQDYARLWIHRETAKAHESEQPSLWVDSFGSAAWVDFTAGELLFYAELPGSPGAPLTASHFDVAVWVRPDKDSTVVPLAAYADRIPTAGKLGGDRLLHSVPLDSFPLPVPDPPPSLEGNRDWLVYVKLQAVDAPNSSPATPALAAYPGELVLLHVQDDPLPVGTQRGTPAPGSNEELVQQSVMGTFDFEVATHASGPSPGGDGDGDDIGFGGAVPCLPTPPNTPPTTQ